MKHLIIGAGAAAISAAQTILRENNQDHIVIVSEDDAVYSRCMLHTIISGERDAKSINFINDCILESPNVKWIKGKAVTRLDGAAKTVYAQDEALASGDTVLIASGARSVIPPVGNLKHAQNVFGLRRLSDARAIVEQARKAKNIAVIGAGLVGLDAVYGILEAQGGAGKIITVVEMAPSILAVNLDEKAALAYQQLFEEKGVEFRLGRKVTGTKAGKKGLLSPAEITSALELDDGSSIPCDMVILAVGAQPETGFLAGSGVELNDRKAVKVDDYLSSNIPGIYAAGDAAGLSSVWPNAKKQGEMAAYNMTGTKWAYTDRFALKNTVAFYGLLTVSLGAVHPQEGDEVLIKEDRFNYRRLILRGGVPAGIILQGEIGSSGFWQHLIKNKVRIDNLGKSPWKVSYADFYGVENNGEYKWVV